MPYKEEDVNNFTILKIFAEQQGVGVYFELTPMEGGNRIEVGFRVELIANGFAYARYITPRQIEEAADPWLAIAAECHTFARKVTELVAMGK